MEEMLVVMGVVAVVAWWMHGDANPPHPQPTQAAIVQPQPASPAPATPAPANPK
jgi:hypothetical protein